MFYGKTRTQAAIYRGRACFPGARACHPKSRQTNQEAGKGRGEDSKERGKTACCGFRWKITTRLSFEEKKPPSKLSHAAKVSGDTVLHGVHRKVQQSNDGDNAGVDAANTLTEDAESVYQVGREIHHAHELQPYRKAHRAEKRQTRPM